MFMVSHRNKEETDGQERMTKLAFFDVDGTLSAPYFMVDGELKPGMEDETWIRYCERHGEDTYEYCRPLEAVKQYAGDLKRQGAKLFVLSTSGSEWENSAKVKFVKRWYPDLFDEFLFVEHDTRKVPTMAACAERENVLSSECELVEDTFRLVLEANNKGMKGTHISCLFCKQN